MRTLTISAFFIVLLIISLSEAEQLDFDPYDVLGISRKATSEEIRKVYKKLVREWHPDKNKSPDAEANFIKIQQAYEILSDEDKREQYDTGGYSSDTVGQWQHHSEGHNFRYSDFTQNFFNSQGSNRRTISTHDFYHRVLPGSHVSPQLIYVYSISCMQCLLWLRTSWQKAAADLESLGVAVSTVDTIFNYQVASRLGVNRVPTIVGIYKEKVYFFKGQITKEELKYFVKSFLPTDFIQKVTSATASEFLKSITVDDKPRAILFSDKRSPTLLYTLMSIKYQQYIKFGFVDHRDEQAADFIRRMNIHRNGPTLLMFKENLTKPAVVLGASEMPRGAINEILEANKFLSVPRLTSQKVFDELCPYPHGAVHTVRLCFILWSDPSFQDYEVVYQTLKDLVISAQAKEDNLNEWLKFMRVHVSKQPAFARSLDPKEKAESQIFLLWRRSPNTGSVKSSNIDFLRSPSLAAQHEFQILLRGALEVAHLQKFQETVAIAPLVDELAPFFVIEILRTVINVIEYGYNFVSNMTEKSFMTLAMFIAFCLSMFNSIFSRNQDTNENRQREPTQEEAETDSTGSSKESNPEESEPMIPNTDLAKETAEKSSNEYNFVRELQPRNYESLVLGMTQGHMTVVLLVDDSAPEGTHLLTEYGRAMRIYARDPKISTTYLNVREYSSWYFEIRRTSSAQPPEYSSDPPTQDNSSLHGSEEFPQQSCLHDMKEQDLNNVCGTVLAMNAVRHWYCIFVPRGVKWQPEKGDGMESAGNKSEDSSPEETYEEALSCWMDRVREGQMPRLYVRQWPGLYIHPKTSIDEDDVF